MLNRGIPPGSRSVVPVLDLTVNLERKGGSRGKERRLSQSFRIERARRDPLVERSVSRFKRLSIHVHSNRRALSLDDPWQEE